MAELTHFYDDENTQGNVDGETYTNSVVSGSSPAQILGSALSANTKYLIVARALIGARDATSVPGCRVQTDDDSTIESKSEMLVEYQTAVTDSRVSYLFPHSFITDASPADVEFQLQDGGGLSVPIDQSSLFLLDLDAISSDNPLGTYYFDATDAGPTDTGGDWTGDANAFDGSAATEATTISAPATLTGEGTTAPTSGATIGEVWVHVRLGGSLPVTVTVDEDSVGGTELGTVNAAAARQTRFKLAAPGGGWTWQKVNDLAISFTTTISTGHDVQIAEVVVYDANGLGYYEQATDASATELSSTEATTILAEISGSDMGTDEHLILGYGRADLGNNGKYGEITLYTALDASSQAEVAYHRREGEDTSEQMVAGFAARHQASSGTPNATIYGETASGGGGGHDDGGGYTIAPPSSLFADTVFEYTAAATSGLDGTETTIEPSGSFTPSVTGNHLIFGHAHGSGTPTALGGMWVESTTTEIRTGDSTPTHNQMWDTGKDDEMMATFQRYSITTAETFNLRAQGAGSDFEVADAWLIVVNLNPPSGDTPGSASPGVIARSFTVDAATPVGKAVDVQDLIARAFTVDAPTAKGAAVDVQDVIARSVAMGAPTLVGPAVDVQDVIARSFALDQVTPVNSDGAPGSASPAATVRAFTVDAPTPRGAAVDVQDLIARSFALGAPTTVGPAVDPQDVIARSFALGVPTLVGPGVQTAPLINRAFALDQVAPAAPRTVTPGVIARVFAFGAPTTVGKAAPVAPLIARVFALDQVTPVAPVTVAPGVIARVFTVDAVTTVGGGKATPAAITRAFTVDIPTLVGPGADVQDLIARVFVLDQVTPVPGGATVAVAAIERLFALDGVTLVGGGVQTAPLIARVFALDQATPVAPVIVTPGVIARAFTVDGVTTVGAAVDVQDLIARAFVLGAPTLAGPGVDVQDLIARVFVLDPVTTANSDGTPGIASPAAIVRAFTVDTPTLVGGAVDVQDLIARAFTLDAVTRGERRWISKT